MTELSTPFGPRRPSGNFGAGHGDGWDQEPRRLIVVGAVPMEPPVVAQASSVATRAGVVGARAGVVGARAGSVGARAGSVGARAGSVGARAGALDGLLGLRLPAHLGVLLGLSAGAYALSLAIVASVQSVGEAALAAERAPALAVIEAAQRDHHALEARVQSARSAYEAAASAYATTGAGFADMEARLKDLAVAMTGVTGSAASLPTGVKLPSVSRSAGAAAAPAVHATTSASGG